MEYSKETVYKFLRHDVGNNTDGFSVKCTVSGVRASLCQWNRKEDWADIIKKINRHILSEGLPLSEIFEVEMNGELYAHWHFTSVKV